MSSNNDLTDWRKNWQNAARLRWREMHRIVAEEEATPKRSRPVEALKLIAASLMYDLDSVCNLPDDHLALPYGVWRHQHPTLAGDLPVDEIPLFKGSSTPNTTIYIASMHIPSAAIRLSIALCLVASSVKKSRFAEFCGDSHDWDRGTLLPSLRSAATAAADPIPTRARTLAEDVAMLVVHRDQFVYGRELGELAGAYDWQQERVKLFPKFRSQLMLDAHLHLINLALEDLS